MDTPVETNSNALTQPQHPTPPATPQIPLQQMPLTLQGLPLRNVYQWQQQPPLLLQGTPLQDLYLQEQQQSSQAQAQREAERVQQRTETDVEAWKDYMRSMDATFDAPLDGSKEMASSSSSAIPMEPRSPAGVAMESIFGETIVSVVESITDLIIAPIAWLLGR